MSIRPGRIGPVHQEQALRRVHDTGLWMFNGEHGKSHQPVILRVGLFKLMHTPGFLSIDGNSRLNPTENTIQMGIPYIDHNGGCGRGFL